MVIKDMVQCKTKNCLNESINASGYCYEHELEFWTKSRILLFDKEAIRLNQHSMGIVIPSDTVKNHKILPGDSFRVFLLKIRAAGKGDSA